MQKEVFGKLLKMKKRKMINKKRGNKKVVNKNLVVGTLLIVLIIMIGGLASADSEQSFAELEAELNNLTSDLTSEGYEWLVNYNVDNYTKADVGVYVEGGNEVIAEIGGVGDEGFYRSYLDGSSGAGLNEGESYKTFDLKIMKGVIKNG